MKIWFTDFWEDFYPVNFILNSLKEYGINTSVNKNNPDLLFHSLFGKEHLNFDCPKVLVSAECSKSVIENGSFNTKIIHPTTYYPDVKSQYVIGNEYPTSSKMVRFPTYAVHLNWIKYNNIPTYFSREKNKFCTTFFGHNGYNNERYEFVKFLSKYKKIDTIKNYTTSQFSEEYVNFIEEIQGLSRGESKLNVMSNYKFNFASEHTLDEGYISEKLVDGFLSGCIPIYRGPNIKIDFENSSVILFNEDCFQEILKYESNKDLFNEAINNNFNLVNKKLDKFQYDIVEFFNFNF